MTRANWQTLRFDQIVHNITERINPAEADTDIYVGLEHLDPESLHIKRWGTPADVKGTKFRFYKGDIIFGRRRAYQRKLAVTEFDGICSAHAMVLRANEENVLPEFLPFFMQSDTFFDRALQISVGSLSPTINWKTMARQEFPLPPKDEQRRIAEILWAVDEAIERYYNLVEATEATKDAVTNQTLSFLKYPKIVSIDNFEGDKGPILKTGPFGSSMKSEYFTDKGVPVFNISALGESTINQEGLFYLSPERAKQFETYTVIENDIVFSRVADVGRCLLLSKECEGWIISSNIIRVRVDETKIFPLFCLYLLKYSPFIKRQIRKVTATGGRLLVNTKTLREVKFPLLPLEEQIQIAELLRDLELQIAELERHIDKLKLLLVSIREHLFFGNSIPNL